MSDYTEYAGYRIRNCPACGGRVTVDTIPMGENEKKLYGTSCIWQVSCFSEYPTCNVRGPISKNNSGDAIYRWHVMLQEE